LILDTSLIPMSDDSFQSTSPWTIAGFPSWCTETGFYPPCNVGNFAGASAATIHQQLDPCTNDSSSDNITFDGQRKCIHTQKIKFGDSTPFLGLAEATYPDFDGSVGRHDAPSTPNSDFSSPSSGCSCSAAFFDASAYSPAASLSSHDVEMPSFPDMAQGSWPSHHHPSSSESARSELSPAVSDQENASRRRFACLVPGCARRFTSQYTLKVHMEAHKPKPRTSFPCTLGCSETFSRQHDRLRHEVAKHGKVCDWLCGDCGRFFSSKKTLGNHKCPCAPGGTRWVTETVRPSTWKVGLSWR
jgi:hypothetical protein